MGSFVTPAAIKVAAETIDITSLSEEAARALAPDVEYRLREVIQDALKFTRHSRRMTLTVDDVNNALRLRNIEPVYGFLGNRDTNKFLKATGHADLYFLEDRILPLEQIISRPLPRAPPTATVMPHWLFIEGVQPQTDENTLVDRPILKRPRLQQETRKPAAVEQSKPGAAIRNPAPAAGSAAPAEGPVAEVALPVQHVLSDELMTLFEQVKVILKPQQQLQQQQQPRQSAAAGQKAAPAAATTAQQQQQQQQRWADDPSQAVQVTPKQLSVLAKVQGEPGMQQLLPFFAKHVADEVSGGLKSLPRLHMVLRLLRALLLNPHVALEPYLAQLMPPLLTCLLAKTMGSAPCEDHWAVRERAAQLLAMVCGRCGEPYYALQVKISKQLLKTFLDTLKPLPSHYGAVVGLAALGNTTLRLLLLPQLEPYMQQLMPLLGSAEYDTARSSGTAQHANGTSGAEAASAAAASLLASASGGPAGVTATANGAPAASSTAVVSPVRQYEAWKVYSALVDGVCAAVYERIVALGADRLPYQLFRGLRHHRTPRVLQKQAKLPGLIQPNKHSHTQHHHHLANGSSKSPAHTRPGGSTSSSGAGAGASGAAAEDQKPAAPKPAAKPAVAQLYKVGSDEDKGHLLILAAKALASAVQGGQMQQSQIDGIMGADQKAAMYAMAAMGGPGVVTPPRSQLVRQFPSAFSGEQGLRFENLLEAAGNAVQSPEVRQANYEAQERAKAEAAKAPKFADASTSTHDATAAGPDDAMCKPKRDVAVGTSAVGGRAVQVEGTAGRSTQLAGVPSRSVRAILADAWRDDADMGDVVWALSELLGETFLTRMPQPGRSVAMLI